jgi:hypothetical protein
MRNFFLGKVHIPPPLPCPPLKLPKIDSRPAKKIKKGLKFFSIRQKYSNIYIKKIEK